MTDLSNMSVTLDCSEIDKASAWSRKLSVDLDGTDMTEFIDNYLHDILNYIGEDEVSK